MLYQFWMTTAYKVSTDSFAELANTELTDRIVITTLPINRIGISGSIGLRRFTIPGRRCNPCRRACVLHRPPCWLGIPLAPELAFVWNKCHTIVGMAREFFSGSVSVSCGEWRRQLPLGCLAQILLPVFNEFPPVFYAILQNQAGCEERGYIARFRLYMDQTGFCPL